MGFEALLSMTGMGSLVADDVFAVQIGVLFATTLFLFCSLIFCLMAFRAAGAARKARIEAFDLATEVRHLTAQVEKSTGRRAPVRVGAGETTPEADVAFIDERRETGDDDSAVSNRTLEAAKKAATVPSALLGGLLRRRS